MSIQKLGGLVAFFYSGVPVLIAWLSTSAEQGLMNAAFAATVVALLQCALRIMDVQDWGQLGRAEDFEIHGVTPSYSVSPKNRRGATFRVLWGD